MTKPVIIKRQVKGTPLTYAELDTNFQNLDDATITLKAGTGGVDVVSDLNGTITLVAGTGIVLSGDNTAKTVTISSGSYYNAGTSSASSWTPSYSNGIVQKLTTTTSTLTVNAPTGMSAGNSVKLIIVVNYLGSNAVVTTSGLIVSDNNTKSYYENSNSVTFISGAGNLTLDIVYDGSQYWTTLNTNYV